MTNVRTEQDVLRRAHAGLTRAYTDLYELLNEIVPPATKPLPADRDVPARSWSQEAITAFTVVKSAYDAVENAQLQLSRLRHERPSNGSERGRRANRLLTLLDSRPSITRDEVKSLLGWDDSVVEEAIHDLAELRSEPAASL